MKEKKFTIGRSRECDIVLADESVSRRHAEITFLGDGKLFLTDCNSTQGTSLVQGSNIEEIKQEFLSPTDGILFGQCRMSVKDLLESIKLKYPSFNGGEIIAQPGSREVKPWVQGSRLVRCSCGAVKKKGAGCPECGRT